MYTVTNWPNRDPIGEAGGTYWLIYAILFLGISDSDDESSSRSMLFRPSEILGGVNLYEMLSNSLISEFDYLGLTGSDCCGGKKLTGRQKCCGELSYTPKRNGGEKCCGDARSGSLWTPEKKKDGGQCCESGNLGTWKRWGDVEYSSVDSCIDNLTFLHGIGAGGNAAAGNGSGYATNQAIKVIAMKVICNRLVCSQ